MLSRISAQLLKPKDFLMYYVCFYQVCNYITRSMLVFQGEIFRTQGGGTAVQFTDVEILKHSKPRTPHPLPRRSIRLANRAKSTSNISSSSTSDASDSSYESSMEWTDVETRVSAALATDIESVVTVTY